MNITITRTPVPAPAYSVVALRGDNQIASTPRTFPTYPAALGYLLHNLAKRPNLDIIDGEGNFIGWEFSPPIVGA